MKFSKFFSHNVLVLFFIALILRLGLIFVAYHGDLNNNISWGNIAVERGLSGLYESSNWPYSVPNQPPLYILLFGFVSLLYQSIQNIALYLNEKLGVFPSSFIWMWEERGMVILTKLPSILADLGIGYLIYLFFKKRKKKDLGIKLSALWLFNPVIWYNSSIWGQTDSIVNLLGLISIFSLLNRKLTLGVAFFVLSVLFKGSLLIFAPILLVLAILQKYNFQNWIKAVVVSLGVVALVCSWFHPSLDLPAWLWDLYTQRIFPGEIGYLTANAFNFWWLVDSGNVLDSTIYFGIPARIWGYIVFIITTVIVVFKLKKNFAEKNFFYSLALMAFVSFLFMTRIHERYLYPFFPVGTILVGFLPGFIIPFLVLSFVHFLNLYHLFWAPAIPFLEEVLKSDWVKSFLSFFNLFIFGLIIAPLARRARGGRS